MALLLMVHWTPVAASVTSWPVRGSLLARPSASSLLPPVLHPCSCLQSTFPAGSAAGAAAPSSFRVPAFTLVEQNSLSGNSEEWEEERKKTKKEEEAEAETGGQLEEAEGRGGWGMGR
eukprot:619385-Rhodomonas_salina.3